MATNIQAAFGRLRHEQAGARMVAAGRRLLWLLKENPYWHLQPRVPAGDPDAGQWMPSGPLAPESALPIIARGAKFLFDALRAIGRRVAPELRRVPRRWDELDVVPTDDNFPELEKRKGPATARRPGHPAMRFRNEEELRRYLGPAGPGRQWHHLVEQRMVGEFAPELIHNTDNIINIPLKLHQEISKRMSQRANDTEMFVGRYYIERGHFVINTTTELILSSKPRRIWAMIPTSSDQLTTTVDRFFDAVEAHGNAIRSGNSKAANRAFDKAEQARTLLGDSTGARGVLETLLAHPSPLVRMWTAADVLKWNPDKAIPVLGLLLIEPFDQEPSPSVRIEVRLTSRGLLYRHFGVSDFDRDKLIEPLHAYGIELPRQRG